MYFALDDLVEESNEKSMEKGVHKGVQLAAAVLRLNAQGLSVEEIASECNTSTDVVEMLIHAA